MKRVAIEITIFVSALATALVVSVTLVAQAGTITLGSAVEVNLNELVALTNSQDTLTADNYDSFESPRGTDYVVPTDRTLYITSVHGLPHAAASTDQHFHIGYGDDGVDNSVSAPTNAVVVCDWSWEAADGPPAVLPLYCPIPEGKYPFIQGTGAGNYQATGVAR